MSESIKILHLRRDILIYQFKLIVGLITSNRLALDRVAEAKRIVKRELKLAQKWSPENPTPINVKFYLYTAAPLHDYKGNISQLHYDHINFSPNKADVCVDSIDKLEFMQNNSKMSLDKWNEVEEIIKIGLKGLVDVADGLKETISEYEQKISAQVYSLDEDTTPPKNTGKKKKKTEEYSQLSEKYLQVCDDLNKFHPTSMELETETGKQPSKATWNRFLNDPIGLLVLKKLIDKRLNNKNLKEPKKSLYVNIFLDISTRISKSSAKIIKSKETSLDERMEFYENRVKDLSQNPDIY